MRRTTSTLAAATAVALVATSFFTLSAPARTAFAAAAETEREPGPRQQFRERMRERMTERRDARQEIDRHLTSEQVRDIVEGRLAMSGNANLKVGKVTAKEENVVSVEVVTKTGALVETREISTRSGLPVAVEKARAARGQRGPGGRGGRFAGTPGDAKDLKLSVDQVRKLAEAQLILRGNPNLKVGAVKEKDADTITVDIVASDNSLVSQRDVDRHTGRPKRNRA